MRLIKPDPSGGPDDWKQDTVKILTHRRSLIIFGTLVLLIALRLGTNWFFRTKHDLDIPRVNVVAPMDMKLDQTLNLPGNIEAVEQASLYAHVSGYLKKIYVDEGDHVKKGQLLADIDAPDVVQEYHKAQADYNLKKVTFDRYKELLKEKVVSQQEYDNIEAEADESKARFDNAAANLSFTKITAPFSGSIARRYKYPGDLITTGTHSPGDQPLFLLVDERQLRVAINVPQIEISQIKIGDSVDIHVDAFPNGKFQGSVSRLDALLDEATKTERVLIDLDNQNESLHAGMFASVSLHVSHVDSAMVIPKECIHDEGDRHFVYVERDQKAFKQEIKLGMEQNGRVQVIGGLSPQDHVIVIGSAILKDGSPVQTHLVTF